jgi:hypothetical protein
LIPRKQPRGRGRRDTGPDSVEKKDGLRSTATHPAGRARWDSVSGRWYEDTYPDSTWPVRPEAAKVRHLGIADDDAKAGVVLASFNAG